jgi:hypothetical protein
LRSFCDERFAGRSSFLLVSFQDPAQDFLRFVSFDQPDGRTAKTAAGEAGSKDARDRGGDFYQASRKAVLF